jgi:hypothetical protein
MVQLDMVEADDPGDHSRCRGIETSAYRFAGAVVYSEIELPELSAAETQSTPLLAVVRYWNDRDIVSCSETLLERTVLEGGLVVARDRAAAVSAVCFPGVAEFRWHDSTSVLTARVSDGAAPHTVRHLLLDQVLPRVMAHGGHTVLHGSCILTERGAVAFVGRSGRGKSTISAALSMFGCKFLSDDGVAVSFGKSSVKACATYPSLRLMPDSVMQIVGSKLKTTAMADYSNKRRVHAEFCSAATMSYPLRAIYALDGCGSLRISQLRGREACAAILGNAFLLDVKDPQRAARQLQSAGQILGKVPIFSLRYPRQFSELPQVCKALVEHWSSLPEPAREEAA